MSDSLAHITNDDAKKTHPIVRIAAVADRAGAGEVAGRIGAESLVPACLGVLALVNV